MAAAQKDNWSSEASHVTIWTLTQHDGPSSSLTLNQDYQNAASFVPKLATKVMQWLDPQKDDVILDVGCGGECLHA